MTTSQNFTIEYYVKISGGSENATEWKPFQFFKIFPIFEV